MARPAVLLDTSGLENVSDWPLVSIAMALVLLTIRDE